jgi:hypothetical protein
VYKFMDYLVYIFNGRKCKFLQQIFIFLQWLFQYHNNKKKTFSLPNISLLLHLHPQHTCFREPVASYLKLSNFGLRTTFSFRLFLYGLHVKNIVHILNGFKPNQTKETKKKQIRINTWQGLYITHKAYNIYSLVL